MLISMFYASASGLASGTTIIYYILGIIVIVVGAVIGSLRVYQRMRKKWTEEGADRAKQQQAIEENNKQLQDNTQAIAKLTGQLTEWVMRVTADMNGFGQRLGKLEEYHRDRKGGV